MKWVIEEKTKHRLIGLAVIVSLATIFIPAMMKNSKHALTHPQVALKLPPKPQIHEVKIVDEETVFQTIQKAPIEAPKVTTEGQPSQMVVAEPLRSDRVLTHAKIMLAQENPLTTDESKVLPAPKDVAVAKTTVKQEKSAQVHPSAPKSYAKKDAYVLQLASFSKIDNAKALVERLRKKGYQAELSKVVTAKSVFYKVCLSPSPDKLEVLKLKTLLAKTMQLNGFLVNTKVS
jgi:DedD protein